MTHGPGPTDGLAYRVESFLSPMFDQWAYVVHRPDRTDAVVVDPGFRTDHLLEYLRSHDLRPVAILNTHGHSDHIAGNPTLKEAYPKAPLIIGKGEAHLLTDPMANLSGHFGQPLTSPEADRLVAEGDRIDLAGFSFEVREVPGHSPGSVIFVALDEQPPFVLGGDVLFAGSIGRFDFPGSDGRLLVEGIRSKLLTLPDETVVYPGHGPSTTVGAEKRRNPFVGEQAGTYRLD